MKGYVLHGIDDLHFEEIKRPIPKSGEVLVKVMAAGICGSDIPRIFTTGAHSHPLIPGHEFSGKVVEAGNDADKKWLNKRVGVFPLIPCKKCRPCNKKLFEMCRNYNYLGSRCDGGFAEYVAVPSDNLIELPDNVGYEEAAMLEPMAVAVHAMRRINPGADDTAAVCGLGTIGLLLVMFLREAGIKNILVIGNKDFQRENALKLGIPETDFCDGRKENPLDWLMLKTDSNGVDAFFECVGRNETVLEAVNAAAMAGKVCFVGNPYSDMQFEKDVYWKILRHQLIVTGSWNSSFTHDEADDWHYVLEKLADKRIRPAELISHRFSLEELNQGFNIMKDKTEDYIKIMAVKMGANILDDVCFLEGSCAEINSAVIKNRFIADTAEDRIIICNKNVTNGDEVISILSENPFLDGYDVVVFGKNVPEGEADFVTIMMACDMFICGMVIKRKLFQKTGCFNERLTALTDYEFLTRAAKCGSVFFVSVGTDDALSDSDCNVDMDESAKYKTIAYLLRNNINLLKSEGILESVFTYFSKCEENSRALDEFNNWTGRYLDDTVLYEQTAKNTAPFLIISGDDTCNGVLNKFADELAGNLVKYGQAVITTNHKYGDMAEFTGRKHPFYKGVVGFQAPALEDDIFRKTNSLKFQMWFDHPAFFNQLFNGLTNDYYILCQDMYYADYLKKYAHVENAIQFPPAGIDAGLSDNKDRKYDVVFIGTYVPATIRELNEFEAEFAKYLLNNPSLTFEAALEQLLEQSGISFGEDEFRLCMVSLYPVCRYVTNYFRNKVVEAILSAGIKLDVFGDTWKDYQGACAENLIIHPLVTVEESLKIWGQSRIGLNIMTWHKAGMTERIANIMLSGAVCLSDETTYLKEKFTEDEDIVLFSLDKLDELPLKINKLLEDEECRRKIAANAYEKASREHTWKKRAEQLLSLADEK